MKRTVLSILVTLAVLLAMTAPAFAEGRPIWPPVTSMSVRGLK